METEPLLREVEARLKTTDVHLEGMKKVNVTIYARRTLGPANRYIVVDRDLYAKVARYLEAQLDAEA